MGRKNKLLRLAYTSKQAAMTQKMIKRALAAQQTRAMAKQNFSGRKG